MKIYIVIDMPEIDSKECAYQPDGIVENIIDQVERIEQIKTHDWWVEVE